jgi:hypothetical protein
MQEAIDMARLNTQLVAPKARRATVSDIKKIRKAGENFMQERRQDDEPNPSVKRKRDEDEMDEVVPEENRPKGDSDEDKHRYGKGKGKAREN